jgi:hypothetical protein
MVGRHFGKERAKDGADQLHQREDDTRILGDLEDTEEEGQHPDETERDLRSGLREVQCRVGDGVQLDESDRLEDDTRRSREGLRLPDPIGRREADQRALKLLVARPRHLADGGQRLGELGARTEPELNPLLRLHQIAGIAGGGTLLRPVKARVLPRLDPDLHRHAAGGRVVAFGERQHHRKRLPVPVPVAGEIVDIAPEREDEAGDDQARPDVVQHGPARSWWRRAEAGNEYDRVAGSRKADRGGGSGHLAPGATVPATHARADHQRRSGVAVTDAPSARRPEP